MSKHKCNIEDIEWRGETEYFDNAIGYYGDCKVCGKEIMEWHNLDSPEYYERDKEGHFNKEINLNP